MTAWNFPLLTYKYCTAACILFSILNCILLKYYSLIALSTFDVTLDMVMMNLFIIVKSWARSIKVCVLDFNGRFRCCLGKLWSLGLDILLWNWQESWTNWVQMFRCLFDTIRQDVLMFCYDFCAWGSKNYSCDLVTFLSVRFSLKCFMFYCRFFEISTRWSQPWSLKTLRAQVWRCWEIHRWVHLHRMLWFHVASNNRNWWTTFSSSLWEKESVM